MQKYHNIILEDDDTKFGGISFVGETVLDFILEIGAYKIDTLRELNSKLKECGIKEIHDDEIWFVYSDIDGTIICHGSFDNETSARSSIINLLDMYEDLKYENLFVINDSDKDLYPENKFY